MRKNEKLSLNYQKNLQLNVDAVPMEYSLLKKLDFSCELLDYKSTHDVFLYVF